ncbi:MAG: GntP family permease [bacterium]|nr:GntP family permease [bacterium]
MLYIPLSLIAIAVAMLLIILSIVKFRLHTFLILIFSAYIFGIISGMPLREVVDRICEGFSSTLAAIGIVIAFGSVIGVFLEKSGGAVSIAQTIIKVVGKSRSPLAMAISGFIISIGVFCDSGFIILAPLNRALAKETKISLATYATALSLGLYSSHTLIPPTPGPLASSEILGADVGTVILIGFLVALPTTIVGYLFAKYFASRYDISIDTRKHHENTKSSNYTLPNPLLAILPIIVPILLILLRSFSTMSPWIGTIPQLSNIVDFLGHPVTAMMTGMLISFTLEKNPKQLGQKGWIAEGFSNSAMIILITGAGGSLGNVLRYSKLLDIVTHFLLGSQLSLLLPFLISLILKTAQGSSTVAMITTASIMQPILGTLGLSSPIGRVLTVCSIATGSMIVSHVNDSYFWVVSQFSNMDFPTAYKTHTLGTLLTGLFSFCLVLILGLILL